ncbi:MAG: hypothetical protein ACLFTB_00360 [Desulfovibrionales bacterium]
MQTLIITVLGILRESVRVSLSLFKIMVPIIIGVKVLQEFDLIRYVALPLEPVMEMVGLPASMGLVWATAMINNLYGAMAVFVNLPPSQDLSTAQVTVLTTMMLVAHNLPIEIKIAQKSGTRFAFQLLTRVGGAVLLGWLLHLTYAGTGLLQNPSTILWTPDPQASGLLSWGWEQVQNLAMVFGIIVGLISFMRLITALRINALLISLMSPVLRMLGIGKEAGTITIIGMTMGLAYGGGLIIHEANSGKVGSKDVFFSLTLMGLSHSVIEDTLLMIAIGGHVSGLLGGRILFSLLFVGLLVHLVGKLDRSTVNRFFYPAPAAQDREKILQEPS